MTTADLHTIELSHDKPRLTGPRPSDIGTVPTGEDRSNNHNPDGTFAPRNGAAKDRAAKRRLKHHMLEARARVAAAVQGALSRGLAPEEAENAANASDVILASALAYYDKARRELGSSSIFVIGPCVFYGAELAIANYLTSEAAKAGLTTEAGMLLHDRALASEQAATRALTAALAATKALSGRKRKGRGALDAILAAGEPVK